MDAVIARPFAVDSKDKFYFFFYFYTTIYNNIYSDRSVNTLYKVLNIDSTLSSPYK